MRFVVKFLPTVELGELEIFISFWRETRFEIFWIQKLQPHQWHSGNAQNRKTGGARFKPLSRLSTYPFGVFRGFLQKSRKYGLGSLRKTPTEGIPPIGLGP